GIIGRRSEKGDLVEELRMQAEKTVHFFFRRKEAQKKFGKVNIFARRGKNVAEEAVGNFGEEAAVGREAGLGEEREAVGFFEDGGDAGAIAFADFRGIFKNGNPDALALQF